MLTVGEISKVVHESLPVFCRPTDVIEIRSLAVGGRYGNTNAGWLTMQGTTNYANRIANIAFLSGSTYYTPQVLKPELLQRRKDGDLFDVKRGKGKDEGPKLTHDTDVDYFRYLLVDVDPLREDGKRGLSSTSEEKQQAWGVLNRVRDLLDGIFCKPVIVDSGNGYHAYYPLLWLTPANPETTGFLRVILGGIARQCNTEKAEVDTSVCNPSRIFKLPGTESKKGRHTKERPHRQSRILEIPDGWVKGGPERADGDAVEWLREISSRFASPVPAAGTTIVDQLHTKNANEPTKRPSGQLDVIGRAAAYLAKMPAAISGQGGHNATFAAACVLWNGFALDESQVYELLASEFNPRCQPPWSESELRHKATSAANVTHSKPRGHLLESSYQRVGDEFANADISELYKGGKSLITALLGRPVNAIDTNTLPELGFPAPNPIPEQGTGGSVNIVPTINRSETDPFWLAERILKTYQFRNKQTLLRWKSEWYTWLDGAWSARSDEEIKSVISKTLEKLFAASQVDKEREYNAGNLDKLPEKISVTQRLVGDVVNAVKSLCQVSDRLQPPVWIGKDDSPVNPNETVSTATQLVEIKGYLAGNPEAILPATPEYFNLNSLTFSISTSCEEKPAQWLSFLDSLWGEDHEQIDLLQEWMGYLLTPDNSLQKMLLMHGPRRAGKGTVANIIRDLVGHGNCCGPTLTSLAGPFGLSPLLGKSVAIIDDARLSNRQDLAATAEILLAISGNGVMNVNRKNLPAIDIRLNTRFVVCTNEIPKLTDLSGALASRWCVLQFERSFEGKEDPELIGRLRTELPLIFRWATEGWGRLKKLRRFTNPDTSRDTIEIMQDTGSIIGSFVREWCVTGPDFVTMTSHLYEAWKKYCDETGKKEYGTVQSFGRELHDLGIGLKRYQPKFNGERPRCLKGITIREPHHPCPDDLLYQHIQRVQENQNNEKLPDQPLNPDLGGLEF